jgi:hypothetical protein
MSKQTFVCTCVNGGWRWVNQDDPDAPQLPRILMFAVDYAEGDKITLELEEADSKADGEGMIEKFKATWSSGPGGTEGDASQSTPPPCDRCGRVKEILDRVAFEHERAKAIRKLFHDDVDSKGEKKAGHADV